YSDAAIERFLASVGAVYEKLPRDRLVERGAHLLADEKVVGWFQGRMEFGPRALGNRSILGDARSSRMQSVMNLKIKFRESFRPFAPSVLRERVADWFELDVDSPYMLLVAPVRPERRIPMTEAQKRLFGIEKLNVPRSEIPAVTHVDHSARIQTVHRETNPLYHALLGRFEALTGCPVLVNTSFNVRRHAGTLRIRRYVQVHTRDDPLNGVLQASRGGPEPYDGVAELWWESREDLQAATASSEGQRASLELLEDERRFIDLERSPLWV